MTWWLKGHRVGDHVDPIPFGTTLGADDRCYSQMGFMGIAGKS